METSTTTTVNQADARWSCDECGTLVSNVTVGYSFREGDDGDAVFSAMRLEPCGHTSGLTMIPLHRED